MVGFFHITFIQLHLLSCARSDHACHRHTRTQQPQQHQQHDTRSFFLLPVTPQPAASAFSELTRSTYLMDFPGNTRKQRGRSTPLHVSPSNDTPESPNSLSKKERWHSAGAFLALSGEKLWLRDEAELGCCDLVFSLLGCFDARRQLCLKWWLFFGRTEEDEKPLARAKHETAACFFGRKRLVYPR